MGWALVDTTWFTNEYTRQLTDSGHYTHTHINNFDQTKTITDSNKLLRKLQIRFNKLLTTSTDKQLLNPIPQDKLQLPYMELLPKVHKLNNTASPSNLDKLTGRPIITAHSWTTSHPSRLIGTDRTWQKKFTTERHFWRTTYTLSIYLQLNRLTPQFLCGRHWQIYFNNFWLHITLHQHLLLRHHPCHHRQL